MKISGLQENLKNGLFVVGHITGKNINLPILNNVLIKAENNNIKLITTDLEIGVTCNVRGKVEKAGGYTVDAKIISEYISLLPNKKIDLEKKENKLIIQSENYKTSIVGQVADDFPLIPQIDDSIYYKTEISEFKKALGQVVFAVSGSETRMELSGVFFNFNKEKLVLAATDSYRLAEKQVKISTNNRDEEKKIIVPAKALLEVVRILSGMRDGETKEEKGEIKFSVSDNQILFEINGIELISRLIEGQYPDYQQIIPSSHKTKAIVSRSELLRAVKVAAIFSKTGINDVNLDFPINKKQIIVSSASSQSGENITNLDADVSGMDNGIVINYRYLLDGLNNIESENVVLEIVDNNTPCIIRPEKNEDYLYIIMPIK